MSDVGDRDLPVPISGNWVIKGCMTNWLRFFTFFNVFFESPKNVTFYVFWDVAHVFSNTAVIYVSNKKNKNEAKRPNVDRYFSIAFAQ